MTLGIRSSIAGATAQRLSPAQQGQPGAIVEVPERPALAPDVQLLGEMQGRGPLGVNARRKVIGPRIIDPITTVLQVLFLPPVLIPALLAIAAAHWWLYALHGVSGSLYASFRTPALFLPALAVLALSGVFHELGHAAALRYGGGKARAIGVGFYLL